MSFIPTRSFMLEVARGRIPGMKSLNKFGANPDVDTGSTPEDVWDLGGLHVPPTVARIHNIASTSTDDDLAGIGMRTMRIVGIVAGWAIQEEDIEMDGTTDVPTANAYLRIYRMTGLSAGTAGTNVGTITATPVVDPTVTAAILAGNGTTRMAIATVPDGVTGFLNRAYGSMRISGVGAALSQMTLEIMQRVGVDGPNPILLSRHSVTFTLDGTSARSWFFEPQKEFVGPCDVFFRVSSVSANNTIVHAGYDMICVDN